MFSRWDQQCECELIKGKFRGAQSWKILDQKEQGFPCRYTLSVAGPIRAQCFVYFKTVAEPVLSLLVGSSSGEQFKEKSDRTCCFREFSPCSNSTSLRADQKRSLSIRGEKLTNYLTLKWRVDSKWIYSCSQSFCVLLTQSKEPNSSEVADCLELIRLRTFRDNWSRTSGVLRSCEWNADSAPYN